MAQGSTEVAEGEIWVLNALRVLFALVILTAILVLTIAISGMGTESPFALLLIPIPAAFTVGVVSLVGLPLRVGRRLRPWWEQSGPTMLIVAVVGLLSVILGLALWTPVTYTDEFGGPVAIREANPFLFWGGWFALAFGIMHIRSPFRSR